MGKVGHVNNWRSRVWADACEAARVKAAPYDGRHTYASLLIHEGRALPYVTAALGHASATTTLDHYAHVFDEARLAPADAFGELRTVDWDVAVTDHGPVVVKGYAGAWPQPISSVPKLPKLGLADNQWSE